MSAIDADDKNSRILKILQMLQTNRPAEPDNELGVHVEGVPPPQDEFDQASQTPVPPLMPAKRRKLSV